MSRMYEGRLSPLRVYLIFHDSDMEGFSTEKDFIKDLYTNNQRKITYNLIQDRGVNLPKRVKFPDITQKIPVNPYFTSLAVSGAQGSLVPICLPEANQCSLLGWGGNKKANARHKYKQLLPLRSGGINSPLVATAFWHFTEAAQDNLVCGLCHKISSSISLQQLNELTYEIKCNRPACREVTSAVPTFRYLKCSSRYADFINITSPDREVIIHTFRFA